MNICYESSEGKLELNAFIDDEGIVTYILGIGESVQVLKTNNEDDKKFTNMIEKYIPGKIEEEKIKILCFYDPGLQSRFKALKIDEQTTSETQDQGLKYVNKYVKPMLLFFSQMVVWFGRRSSPIWTSASIAPRG